MIWALRQKYVKCIHLVVAISKLEVSCFCLISPRLEQFEWQRVTKLLELPLAEMSHQQVLSANLYPKISTQQEAM